MKDATQSEQRRFQRFILKEPSAFNDGDETGALSRDISATGTCLEVNRFVRVGSTVSVQVPLSKEQVIEALARVMWIREIPMSERFRIGVHFEKFTQGNAADIVKCFGSH